MARTPEAALLTARHRRLQLALRAAAAADLLRLWRTVDPTNLSDTIRPFVRAATVVVQGRRRDSAAVAGRYYREFRRLEGIPGAVLVAGDATPPSEVFDAALRGAALGAIVRARRSGFPAEAAARNGFVKTAGAATGLVLGGGRSLLIEAITADRAAQGWQRATSGQPCAFCRMIAGRGPVFKTERSAGFEAHDHCSCTVEPHFEGSRPLPENVRFRQEFAEATAGLSGSEALRAYRRALEGRTAAA